MLDISSEIPNPLKEIILIAYRLNAAVVVFDAMDRTRHVTPRFRELYHYCDFSQTLSYDSLFYASWTHSPKAGSYEDQLAATKRRRNAERLEFKRTSPTTLLCAHTRLSTGWSAQIRIENDQPGFSHFFDPPAPAMTLIDALKQRDAATMRADALEAIGLPVIILSETAQIRFTNNAALSLFNQAASGFRMHGQNLALADLAAEAQLLRTVKAVAQGTLRHPLGGQQVLVTLHTGGAAYTVSVSKCRSQLDDVVVLVIVPAVPIIHGPHHVHVTTTLRQTYGLSPAQAELASLVGMGMETSDAAGVLEKSVDTAREQMKAVYRKLTANCIPVRSQSTLTAWITLIVAITGSVKARINSRRSEDYE